MQVEGIGDKGADGNIVQRAKPVRNRTSSRAADIAVDAAENRRAQRWRKIIFDRAKASDRNQTAMGLIGKYLAVQECFRRRDREIGAHELIIAELEARSGRKRKGTISLDDIQFDVGVEALG